MQKDDTMVKFGTHDDLQAPCRRKVVGWKSQEIVGDTV